MIVFIGICNKANYPHIIGISGKTGAGKSTLSKFLANELQATLISWNDYDDISEEPDDFIAWYHHGQDYDAFKRQALSKNLEELKNNKGTLHAVSNQILPATPFIIFDAPLGRLHQETGKFIDIMIHLDVPLDILLCRRLLRDFKEQDNTKDLLEEIRFYLENSRPLYFDNKLKDTADLVVDGMLSPKQELMSVMRYLNGKMSSSFMNAENKITIKPVNLDDTRLPLVIQGAIGNPSENKVLEVIKSYGNPDNEIIGAFVGDILIGMIGISKSNTLIIISHISVLIDYQRRGIGTLLLEEIKKRYERYRIIAETDTESVDFYAKSGFTCHGFNGPYGNLRYKCEFKQG